jgi:hypothetical protein
MRTFTVYVLALALAVVSAEALWASHRADALDRDLADANEELAYLKNGNVAQDKRLISYLEERATKAENAAVECQWDAQNTPRRTLVR